MGGCALTVGPGVPVNGHPGGVGLGVEGAGRGVRLVGGHGHGGVAVGLEVGAPGLVGLVPVAGGLGVVPDGVTYRVNFLSRHDLYGRLVVWQLMKCC